VIGDGWEFGLGARVRSRVLEYMGREGKIARPGCGRPSPVRAARLNSNPCP